MALDDTSQVDADQTPLPAIEESPDGVPSDLVKFEYQWSRELQRAKGSSDRAERFVGAGAVAEKCSERDTRAGWDFVRTWLRRLADDLLGRRVEVPLPAELERSAQKVLGGLLAREQSDINDIAAAISKPDGVLDLLKRSPRTVGSLRELARIVSAFRGTGLLSLADPGVIDELLAFDKALAEETRHTLQPVPDYMRISRDELLAWADAGAGADLPALVRRLVLETGQGIEHLHFPAGTGTAAGGWDGEILADGPHAFVPAGKSVWELSVAKNSNEKAEKDYKKRVKAAGGNDLTDTTYVELICRPWTKASTFVAEHNVEGRWREVRAYNVDDLETWLEGAPATTVWLSERIGRPVSGVRTAEDWWQGWLASTTIPLRSDIVLAGRDAEVKALRERVSTERITTLGGEVRLEEVRAFVAASLESSDGEQQGSQPVLFVDDLESATRLLRLPGEFVILVQGSDFLQGMSRTSRHHILVPVLGSDRADIVLPPVATRLVRQAFEAAGQTWRDAVSLGELARRSLLAARRRLAVNQELHRPRWAAPGADALKRRSLLLNAWNQSKSGDCEMVSDLIGLPYLAVEDALTALANAPEDPMVSVIDQRWHVVSPMDTWLLLGPQLTASDLDEFGRVALAVLLELDPTQALPASERWRASLDGVSRRFSSEFTRGIAKSLALLGSVDEIVSVGHGRTGSTVASSIVWQLLQAANTDSSSQTWTSLAPHLPLLAEAAPEVVLREVRQALVPGGRLGTDIFADKERSEFGSPAPSPHTHFLWTLENLVWAPDFFDEAVSILALLADLDPGGEWANRPAASLQNIFCPWHPNTSASAGRGAHPPASCTPTSPSGAEP